MPPYAWLNVPSLSPLSTQEGLRRVGLTGPQYIREGLRCFDLQPWLCTQEGLLFVLAGLLVCVAKAIIIACWLVRRSSLGMSETADVSAVQFRLPIARFSTVAVPLSPELLPTHSDHYLHYLAALEASVMGSFLSPRNDDGRLSQLAIERYVHLSDHPLPPTVARRSVGYANVARSQPPSLPLSHEPPPPSPSALVAHADGFDLHLSPRAATDYVGVTFCRSRSLKPFRAKAGGKLLGYFPSAVDAAVCYAQYAFTRANDQVAAQHQPDVASEATLPTGVRVRLQLSARSATGYWGVRHLAGRNLAKPYVARLGPAAADLIGYYETAVDAGIAVATALFARDCASLLGSSLHDDSFFDQLLLDLPTHEILPAWACTTEPSDAVSLAPALELGGAIPGHVHTPPATGTDGALREWMPAVGAGNALRDG